jgi:hypothetical protein
VNARIQRLRAEVTSDREAFEQRIAEIEPLRLAEQATSGELAQAAVALHHAYSAVEAALARVARALGEGPPEGSEWHQELLHVMGLELEGVRPAVLSAKTSALLQPLLAFRHFFRHAYAVPLDAERLAALRIAALDLRPHLAADFDRLDTFLEQLAAGTAQ